MAGVMGSMANRGDDEATMVELMQNPDIMALMRHGSATKKSKSVTKTNFVSKDGHTMAVYRVMAGAMSHIAVTQALSMQLKHGKMAFALMAPFDRQQFGANQSVEDVKARRMRFGTWPLALPLPSSFRKYLPEPIGTTTHGNSSCVRPDGTPVQWSSVLPQISGRRKILEDTTKTGWHFGEGWDGLVVAALREASALVAGLLPLLKVSADASADSPLCQVKLCVAKEKWGSLELKLGGPLHPRAQALFQALGKSEQDQFHAQVSSIANGAVEQTLAMCELCGASEAHCALTINGYQQTWCSSCVRMRGALLRSTQFHRSHGVLEAKKLLGDDWRLCVACGESEQKLRSCEKKLKKCTGCKQVYLCSQDCQRRHWKGLPQCVEERGHRYMCKLLAK